MGGITEWIWRTFWGLFGSWALLFASRRRVLLLGLDNTGKSSLLRVLLRGSMAVPERVHVELSVAGCRMDIRDISPRSVPARKAWRDELAGNSGVIFMVDCSDAQRLAEARTELETVLAVPELENLPVAAEMCDALGLPLASTAPCRHAGRPIRVFPVSLVCRSGYSEAIQWLATSMS